MNQKVYLFHILLVCLFISIWSLKVDAARDSDAADRALVSTDESLIAQDGKTLNVPICISTLKPLSGFQLSLKFNPNILTPERPTTTERTAGMSVAYNVSDNRIIVLVYDVSGATIHPGDGPVLSIPFSIMKDADGETEIRFQQVILADEEAKSVPVDIKSVPVTIEKALPSSYDLLQNYPNPFNPETVVQFQLPEAACVTLTICNVLGQEIRTLVNERKEGGYYKVIWDGRNEVGQHVASGIYFYSLKAGTFSNVKKMMMLK